MRVLHINSYYILAPFYKSLYDRQSKIIDLDVYVPINRKHQYIDKDLGNYSSKAVLFDNFDRIMFHKKEKKIIRDINKRYQFGKYDLVHAHSLFANGYIAYYLKKQYGIPYVVAVRNTDLNVFLKKLIHLRTLGQDILREASEVVFISKPYKDYLFEKYIDYKDIDNLSEKSVVIPNGINEYWLSNIQNDIKVIDSKKEIKILCVGDIDNNKNHIKTVAACKLLLNRGYKIEFNIVGRISNKTIYKKLTEEPFVNYHGTMSKIGLKEMYRNNDIFVMPSKTETFGLVYGEAMSQGLPVIYTKGQGFDGQFDEGIVGYHVDSGDEKDIANKIELAIENRYSISCNCIEMAKRYDWDFITDEYIKLYRELI